MKFLFGDETFSFETLRSTGFPTPLFHRHFGMRCVINTSSLRTRRYPSTHSRGHASGGGIAKR
jgi:hypothetical protein